MTPAKGYAEMKDSGILGCGSIPSHWGTIPLKYVSLLDGKVDTSYIKPEDEVSFAPMECVRNDKRIPRTALKSKDNGTYSSFCDGDIAIAKVTPCFENGNICIMDSLENGYAFGSSELFSIRPTNIVRRFLFYCLQTPYFIDGGVATMTGVGGLKRVSSYYMKNAKIALPPFPEQSAIAANLDTQCAKIDEIIAQAKASIEDYKQWKASIIYEAVTKGLDPNVEMKDSGVEWIGEVPMRWKIVRLKYLLSTPLQYGANETGLPYDESLPRYIRITDITLDGKLKTSGMQSLSEEKSEGYILDDEDILLARSGATVGKAFYYRESYGKAAFAGYLIRAKINSAKALPKFIYYSTMSAGYEKWKETAVIQATIQNIGASRYNEYSLAIPPIAEQLRIIEFLDDKMEKIDSLMAEKQSLIDDLES